MELVYIGRVITTHGIKGEIKLRSNFIYKDKAFKEGNTIYINKDLYTITSYRKHKEYDMLVLKEIDDISKAIPLKQSLVYINRDLLNLNSNYVYEDYIGSTVYFNNKKIGVVKDIIDCGNNNMNFVINKKYVPFNNNFIESFDKDNKTLVLKNVEELL